MKFFVVCVALLALVTIVTVGCGEKSSWQEKADIFLAKYQQEVAGIELKLADSYWKAANSGKEEDFNAYAASDLEMKTLHSDSARYAEIKDILTHGEELSPMSLRALVVAELAFKENQLPADILGKMAKAAAGIEQKFNNYRGKIDGKAYSDNELSEMLKSENNSGKRQKIWEALKQVGREVAPKLIELAGIRNEAAKKLGYKNYWDMQIRLQEHDPGEILSIFGKLEKVTDEPYKNMKTGLDGELAERFGIKAEEMMPWHYDNPFFQEPPPSARVDIDEFYQGLTKEDVVELGKTFFADIGLPAGDLLERSDLYEREGKQQHAFSIDMNRKGDARILVNIKPNVSWMDTLLHELGHAVYSKFNNPEVPYNLRDSAHAFTTEGVAQLFGALSKNPVWISTYTNADKNRVKELAEAILEQRRREQLIFARWSMVMLYFEKAFYEDPSRDLNALWWEIVSRYQMLTPPKDRNAADWAAKIHFTIAPVYYHNYMLGELFSAQMRASLVKLANHQGPAHTLNFKEHKEFGDFFKQKIFAPGMTKAWPEFVKDATGEPLTPDYFANELK